MSNHIAIVTDSTADIPDELLIHNNINIVNNLIIIDGRCYEDRIEISRQEFYERLPEFNTFPTTATASSGAYEKVYDTLLHQGFENIISIHASRKLSGIYNAACLAAQKFGDHIRVVDSQMISLGLGFQVIAAADAARQGLPFQKIILLLNNLCDRIRLIAMLDTLEFVRRSGRVHWVRARLGDALRIKLLLEVKSGEVLSIGQTRTRPKGVSRLINILNNLGDLEKLAILHTNAEQDAINLLKSIKNHIATTPLLVNVTTVIGSHVGPNGLGFAALIEQK
jgi:DegV family protein with EDD domain